MCFIVFILCIFLSIPNFVFAREDTITINEIVGPVESALSADHGLKMGIIINEIAWMGTPVQNVDPGQWWRYEWLELHNSTENMQSLEDWKIELWTQSRLVFSILLSGTVSSHEFFVVGASKKIQGVSLSYENLTGKLSNSGMQVLLKDGVGNLVDSVDASSFWQAGDNITKQTMERTAGLDDNVSGEWHASKSPGGTPGKENSIMIAKTDTLKSKQAPKMEARKENMQQFDPMLLVSLPLSLGASLGLVLLRRRLF